MRNVLTGKEYEEPQKLLLPFYPSPHINPLLVSRSLAPPVHPLLRGQVGKRQGVSARHFTCSLCQVHRQLTVPTL